MEDDKAETYDASQFERPSVTVDVVIFSLIDDTLKALLIKRKNWPFQGMWAIPGGFVRMDESLEDAATRELAEETGYRASRFDELIRAHALLPWLTLPLCRPMPSNTMRRARMPQRRPGMPWTSCQN